MTFCYTAVTTYGLCCDFLLYDNFVQKQRSSHAEVILFWEIAVFVVSMLLSSEATQFTFFLSPCRADICWEKPHRKGS